MNSRYFLSVVLLALPLAMACSPRTVTQVWAVGQSGQNSGFWVNGVWFDLQGASPSSTVTVRCIGADGGRDFAVGGANGNVPGYWLDLSGSFTALTPPAGSTASVVDTLVVSGSTVLAGAQSLAGTALPGYWSNGSWVQLGADGYVSALAVSGHDIFAGGSNGTAVGFWQNATWNPLTPAPGSVSATVASIAVSGGNVYVGGSCGNIPGYWQNGTWIPLASPVAFTAGCSVQAMVVVGTDVYAACSSPGSAGSVAGYWLNQVWVDLTPASGSISSSVTSLWQLGGEIYAGGSCTTALGMVGGYWLNGAWTAVPPVLVTDANVQVVAIAAGSWPMSRYN